MISVSDLFCVMISVYNLFDAVCAFQHKVFVHRVLSDTILLELNAQ